MSMPADHVPLPSTPVDLKHPILAELDRRARHTTRVRCSFANRIERVVGRPI